MATSGFIYEKALPKLFNGSFDLDSHSWKAALLTASHVPDEAADEFWSDISGDEVSGTNYTAGGVTLSGVSISVSSGVLVWDANDALWNTPNYTFRFVAIYNNTLANKDLLILLDYGATANPGGNTFYVRFDNPDGILKATKV
jgi:hypothetical protein